jgi:Helix-turn-helix domain
MTLNKDETTVLRFLGKYYNGEGGCFPFEPICQATRLNRARVRRACRSLKRKGFAEFYSGLWSDDGLPAGSGYCCTESGMEQMKL